MLFICTLVRWSAFPDKPTSSADENGAVGGAAADAVPIDENLFDADDLEGLDEELEELDISQ